MIFNFEYHTLRTAADVADANRLVPCTRPGGWKIGDAIRTREGQWPPQPESPDVG